VSGPSFGFGRSAVAQAPAAEHVAVPRDRLLAERTTATQIVACAPADDYAGLPLAAGDMDAKSFAALSLAPLIAIARADGGARDRATHMVLTWAGETGLRQGDAAYSMVERWLADAPIPKLLAVWKTCYVPRLSLVLSPEAKRALKLEIWNRATALIAATGPFSGIGQAPSRQEQAVLEEIDAALS
jgi:hypothetical protein